MRSWLRVRLPLAASFFGALCLMGPQWGGSYAGAEWVDALLVLLVSLVRCFLAAAVWVRALAPDRLFLRKLWPLALTWLVTSQLIPSLGELMPLVAELFAGEAWLEDIYPYGQLIYTGFLLIGWLLTLMAGVLWYCRCGGHWSGKLLRSSVLGLVSWGLILWGLRIAADTMAMADTCGAALILDTLELAGPALILAHWAKGVEPLSDTPKKCQVLSLLWVPAVWFFTQYGFLLRLAEALADYGTVRAYWLLPWDLMGDLVQVGALWLFAALCACRVGGVPITGKRLLQCAPAAALAVVFALGHSAAVFPLQETMVTSEYQVLPCLGWVGASLLWQTLGLALPILTACLVLRVRPLPWIKLLLLTLGLTAAELMILLASYGLALHPAGYSFGLALAIELPFAELIGFHALVLAAAVAAEKNKQGEM